MRVTITKPCTENWEKMNPNTGTSRFCDACQKCVIDFSTATDKEIISKLKSSKGEVCGKFSDAQLNRDLVTQNTPSKIHWSTFFSVLLASIVGVRTPVSAQSKMKTEIIRIDTLKNLTPIGYKVEDLTVQSNQKSNIPENAPKPFERLLEGRVGGVTISYTAFEKAEKFWADLKNVQYLTDLFR